MKQIILTQLFYQFEFDKVIISYQIRLGKSLTQI